MQIISKDFKRCFEHSIYYTGVICPCCIKDSVILMKNSIISYLNIVINERNEKLTVLERTVKYQERVINDRGGSVTFLQEEVEELKKLIDKLQGYY